LKKVTKNIFFSENANQGEEKARLLKVKIKILLDSSTKNSYNSKANQILEKEKWT
jgi:hypothetical protein